MRNGEILHFSMLQTGPQDQIFPRPMLLRGGPACGLSRAEMRYVLWPPGGSLALKQDPTYGIYQSTPWPMENHRKTIGKPLENGGLMGFNGIYPLVMTNIAMENNKC